MAAGQVRLGVDFGTSNTAAMVHWPDGRARPLLFDGSPLLPSAVYAEPAGALVVGRDAVHSARLEPSRFEPNPKRRVDDGTVLLGDREIGVVDLIAAVLARVSEEFGRTVGAAPDGGTLTYPATLAYPVTLTYPATWGATRRLVLSDAAAAAGLGPVRLVAEPVAAARYFTQVLGRSMPVGSVVVVYDFGAGTFDVSVVARTAAGFEVLAVDGRDDLGGLDLDHAVVRLIGTACADGDRAGAWRRLTHPSTVEERRARRLLWDDARAAKERLSRSPTADVTVPLLNAEAHLTRAELEEPARPLIDQTVRVTQGVMRWANVAQRPLAGVFLVGGSSRIPLVATLLHRALGEAPTVIEQPELVVVEGSVLDGAEPTTAMPTEPVRVPTEPVREPAGPLRVTAGPVRVTAGPVRMTVEPDSRWPPARKPEPVATARPQPGPGVRPQHRELVRAQLADPWGILTAILLGGLCIAVVAATAQAGAVATALYGAVVATVVYAATVVVGVLVEAARARR